MDTQSFLDLVATILEVEAEKLSLTDNLFDIDWDSLSNISFIAEIDERLGLSIDADELANAATIADLKHLVDTAAA
ncbi:acyl carrier protein [Leucobacter sp. UT-8R-CII-1-4]|uniref:acyl carrier protein n=1 Tax=Leucobacter sp. UT-8R-CII-1-4 TaxID=3040075 RepID=UPI0024A96E66|nr:acyl carrier protein [Leucobacter sp. UT-8R-CII-1-4]MDI6023762.1 acyl carrier protein [Leucobacter sp. UT-8R-CII-1-4]